jgi:hypothetical protein
MEMGWTGNKSYEKYVQHFSNVTWEGLEKNGY